MYFANPCTPAIRAHMAAGELGMIDTPLQGNRHIDGALWVADNGCFNDERFTETRWWNWLEDHADKTDNCVFATAPDVLADAAATLKRSASWLLKIRELGYPAAFVAQDGAHNNPPPWDDFDTLFIGGTDQFKDGPIARQLAAQAIRRGKHVHIGRVNNYRRFRYAEAIGCHSVDGTFLTYAPDQNLIRLNRWITHLHERPALFNLIGHP